MFIGVTLEVFMCYGFPDFCFCLWSWRLLRVSIIRGGGWDLWREERRRVGGVGNDRLDYYTLLITSRAVTKLAPGLWFFSRQLLCVCIANGDGRGAGVCARRGRAALFSVKSRF